MSFVLACLRLTEANLGGLRLVSFSPPFRIIFESQFTATFTIKKNPPDLPSGG